MIGAKIGGRNRTAARGSLYVRAQSPGLLRRKQSSRSKRDSHWLWYLPHELRPVERPEEAPCRARASSHSPLVHRWEEPLENISKPVEPHVWYDGRPDMPCSWSLVLVHVWARWEGVGMLHRYNAAQGRVQEWRSKHYILALPP